MKRLYYIIVTVLGIFILSWVLPWLTSLCFPHNQADPFVSWSPISERLIVSMPLADGQDEPEIFDYIPATGVTTAHYNRDQRDSLLPEMYVNQLASKGLLPDSIRGIEMSMHNVRRNRWVFGSQPRNINRSVPGIYPLMESMPARFELQDPQVVLTMDNNGVRIIDMETNAIDSVKTRRFARMFAERGFCFPAREASANITTRKAYDNGYLIIDNNGNLFHLKMQVGRPSMARIGLPENVVPVHAFVTESADRLLYGLVSASDGSLWAIEREGYRPVRLPAVSFDPEKQRITILKSLFSWVIKIANDKEINWVILDSQNDCSLLGEYSYTYPASRLSSVGKWIFPFTTSFTRDTDMHVYPRIADFSWHAVFLNMVLAVIVLYIMRRHRRRCRIANFAITLVFGIFAFIPVIFIKHQ